MSLTELLSVVVAIGTALYAFTQRASGIRKDLINDYEKRVLQLEKGVKELTEKITFLQKALDDRDNQIRMLTEILRVSNPNMEQLMKTVNETVVRVNDFIARTDVALLQILQKSPPSV